MRKKSFIGLRFCREGEKDKEFNNNIISCFAQILMIAFKALPPLNMMSETAALEKSIAVSAYEKVNLSSPFCGVVCILRQKCREGYN